MHGYALAVRLEFAAQTLDDHGWVVDFGDLKQVKAWLVENYDHKTLVAADDPEMQWFEQSHAKGLIDLRVVQNIGCEAFATEIFDYVTKWLESCGYGSRCRLHRVTVSEHAGNSASLET
jgi:6-pyruvoyltetrahydropterin/6-carboxytetrahydropterin synthase